MSAEGKTAEERKVAWDRIRQILPRQKTPEDKKRRIALFKQFDADGSKSLTLEETYQGLIEHCQLDEFTTRLKDITKRAFNKAKSLGTDDRGAGDEDQVEFLEFRLMLCYIYDYFELTVMFDEIDTDGSMMIDEQEFKEAVPRIAEWGVQINDPDATFRQIDANGSGQMTFDEFCAWASAAKLDADGDPDNTAAPGEVPPPQEEVPVAAARGLPDEKTAEERKVAWDRIRQILPRQKTPEDKKRRIALFKQFDADGSKSLTLEETYQGLIEHCQLDEFTNRLKDITVRAFNKAKSLGTDDRGAGDEDQVEFLEFRLMLCYIYDYFELTVMFDEIDTDGSMMIDEQEFKEAVPRIAEWGVQINDPDATFRQIDANGSGQMTFDEFCAWASAAKLDADGDPDNTAAPGEVPPPQEEVPVAAARGLPDEKTAEERKVAWDRIRQILPRQKTPEDKKRRIALFKQFDADGSKSLTLDETYQGLIEHCQLDEFTTRLKDITKRAFNKAKSLGTEDRGAGDEDQVEFLEFRLMLCYIYDYFELTVMFDEIDTDGSMMIDEQEFKEAVPRIAEWGVQINDPDATFRQIDANGSGQMTFDEFCAWASAAKLDADGDPDNTAAPGEVPPPQEEVPVAAARGLPDEKTAEERKVAWDRIRQILPRQKTPEDKKRRIALFKQFDADGSKSLTLEETYQGLIEHCQLDEFTNRLKDITVRAFNKAKSLGTDDRGAGDEDQVEFLEFRLMLCYIYDYFELTVMFDEIDTDGSMMIDEQEFKEAVPRIAEWGVQINDPDATFRQIDANGSGQMTFDEFCAWASAAKLDADGDPDNTAGPGEVPPPQEENPDTRVFMAMPDDVRARSASRGAPEVTPADDEVATRVFKKMPREVRERRSRIREERLSGIRGSRIGDRAAQAPPLAATAPEAEVPAMAEDEPVAVARAAPADAKPDSPASYPTEEPNAIKPDSPADHPVEEPVAASRAVPEAQPDSPGDYPTEEPADAKKADSPGDYPTEEPAAAGAARDIDAAPAAAKEEPKAEPKKSDSKKDAKKDAKKDDKKDDEKKDDEKKDDEKKDKKDKDKGGCCMVM